MKEWEEPESYEASNTAVRLISSYGSQAKLARDSKLAVNFISQFKLRHLVILRVDRSILRLAEMLGDKTTSLVRMIE